MGWCSATEIFDFVSELVLLYDRDGKIDKEVAKGIIFRLFNVLEEHDWDCQNDSIFFYHPLVKEIISKEHPNWYDDEEE